MAPVAIDRLAADAFRAFRVFAEDEPESWADRMAAELLLQAHPSLPLDYSEFPHVLTAESMADLYDGLFKREASAVKTAIDFAPGLGLAGPENPDLFDAGDCAVVSAMIFGPGAAYCRRKTSSEISPMLRGSPGPWRSFTFWRS